MSNLFAHSFFIDRTLSGAVTLGQSGPGSNDNEEVRHIPQISKAGASSSNGLFHTQDTRWWVSYSSAEMQSVYSTAPADWAVKFRVFLLIGANANILVEDLNSVRRFHFQRRHHYVTITLNMPPYTQHKVKCVSIPTEVRNSANNLPLKESRKVLWTV